MLCFLLFCANMNASFQLRGVAPYQIINSDRTAEELADECFDALIYPTTREDFFKTYYQKKPMHIRNKRRSPLTEKGFDENSPAAALAHLTSLFSTDLLRKYVAEPTIGLKYGNNVDLACVIGGKRETASEGRVGEIIDPKEVNLSLNSFTQETFITTNFVTIKYSVLGVLQRWLDRSHPPSPRISYRFVSRCCGVTIGLQVRCWCERILNTPKFSRLVFRTLDSCPRVLRRNYLNQDSLHTGTMWMYLSFSLREKNSGFFIQL